MKHSAKLLIFALPLAMAFAGCDEVNIDDRYEEMPYFEPARTILLEDFTGQRCANCPAAHADIDAIIEQYGDAVIPVAIHGGATGFEYQTTNKRYTGLADADGAYYGNKLSNTSARPIFVIDRQSEEYAPVEGKWQTAVRAELAKLTDYAIEIDAWFNPADSTVSVASVITNKSKAQVAAKYQLWLLEDGIIARQQLPTGGFDEEYVHNHVLRAPINGYDGDDVTIAAEGTLDHAGQIRVVNNDLEKWVPANLSVVGFVYNDNGVQEVAKVHVRMPE